MTRAWMLVLFAGDGSSMYAADWIGGQARRGFTHEIAKAHPFATPHECTHTLVSGFAEYAVPGRFAIVRVARVGAGAQWAKVPDPENYRGRTAEGGSYYFERGMLEVLGAKHEGWKEVAADD